MPSPANSSAMARGMDQPAVPTTRAPRECSMGDCGTDIADGLVGSLPDPPHTVARLVSS
ncbi:hypothetical protein TBR22_A16700 [Luteitalea sp. TBR-22]|nr:hypothetical protein TBR22_A16700 [Luteitalea sp. TBR-22]